eukprot:TRINITY_DN68605_c0_g1_i1.p1 TRINITY_DN68605_c0_g1~~TRINITY_DN68605_c0_g1_i1.p1  ORF type:complete len:670 (-),score=85.54 TRINITY_DN68605_c0_g1_i1:121-2130(-)
MLPFLNGPREPLVGVARNNRAVTLLGKYCGCGLRCLADFANVVPIVEWLGRYRWRQDFWTDLSCGLTLGCILISQSMAHASLCHVQLIHGPYSCILPPLIYALFGTSREGSVGTGALVSLLTGIELLRHDTEERTRAGSLLSLLVGLIITVMGILRLSFLVRFLSRPALSGFVTGSALLIISSMIGPMVGLKSTIAHAGIVKHFRELFSGSLFADINPATCCISLLVLVFLIGSRELKRRCRASLLRAILNFKELLVVTLCAVFCFLCGERFGVVVVGEVAQGLPTLTFPVRLWSDLGLVRELAPSAFLIAVVVFISSYAAAQQVALRSGYRISAHNELLAMGLANVSSALSGGVPVQIGLSRSALAWSLGVRSQLGSGLFVAAVVATIVQFLSGWLYHVPRCALNAIIVSSAVRLTEFHQAKLLYSYHSSWGERKDLAIWCIAFFGTLTLGAFLGMCLAALISLLLIIYAVAEPGFAVLGHRFDESGDSQWVNIRGHQDAKEEDTVLIFRIQGPMFYANSDRLREYLEEQQLASRRAKLQAVIFSAASVSFVDSTAVHALKEAIESCTQRGIRFYIASAYGPARRLFERVLLPSLQHANIEKSIDGVLDIERHRMTEVAERESSPPQRSHSKQDLCGSSSGRATSRMMALLPPCWSPSHPAATSPTSR